MNNPCGTVQIQRDKLLSGIRQAIIAELEAETETLLSIMRREIHRTTHGGAPGKPDWRDELEQELREVYRVIANGVIEFGVGLPFESYADAGYKFVRAMVIVYGSGSKVGNPPIQSRPGEIVWDDDLYERQPSTAKSAFLLPEEFNQTGNDFIRVSMELMKTHFEAMLAVLPQKIADRLFQDSMMAVRR